MSERLLALRPGLGWLAPRPPTHTPGPLPGAGWAFPRPGSLRALRVCAGPRPSLPVVPVQEQDVGGELQGAWPSCSCWTPGLALLLLPGCTPSWSLPGGLEGWRVGALVDTLPRLLHSGRPLPCKPPAFLGGGVDPETLGQGVGCPCGQVHLLDSPWLSDGRRGCVKRQGGSLGSPPA